MCLLRNPLDLTFPEELQRRKINGRVSVQGRERFHLGYCRGKYAV